jgi:hypothetical protein
MDMRMQAQVLPPGMKNTDGSRLCCVMAIAERAQCAPHTSKQSIVKPFAIQHANIMERLRNGKDKMIMFHRISMIYSILYPERLVRSLALWTVAVTATVVTDLIASTMVTPVLMTAQGRGPAFG